jgi:hypothetical protein
MHSSGPQAGNDLIDRRALVTRHSLDWTGLEGQIPVGNGNFAFNADATGLQTLSGNTMSHWCWHSFPLPSGITPDQVPPWGTTDRGRLKGNTTPPPEPLYAWLRANPHPLNLGRLGFVDREFRRLQPADIRITARHFDLWTGLLASHFDYKGEPVTVLTCVDPCSDTISVQVHSPLLRNGDLQLDLDFPAPALGDHQWLGDFNCDDGHTTAILRLTETRLDLGRTVDDTRYQVALAGDEVEFRDTRSPHRFGIKAPAGNDTLNLVCHFGLGAAATILPNAPAIREACAGWWPAFWHRGGAIDLSDSKDPRWQELERRIVLSQYHMTVQSSGVYPPAECGLTGTDPWHAKWHYEMIWWHLAHYALWDRWSMATNALAIYQQQAPMARAFAENFSYRGLMWPKAVGPSGTHTGYPPSLALLWREPHPIFLAELGYRNEPGPATLDQWKDIVFGTADFLADYPVWNELAGQYDLDPVWPASEGPHDPLRRNTIFELGYWQVALEIAQQWRLRLSMERDPRWDEVAGRLAPLPVKDGLYVYDEDRSNTYTLRRFEHLDIIGIAGMLPPFRGLDPATAQRTVREVARDWDWERCWGWDFPWLAMAAARVGEPGLAIEALLNPAQKNRYDERGLCLGGPSPYLPGNGGLLYAIAMMTAGWDGAPGRHAPGFPDDGSWNVRWEGLKSAP